jgi:adenylate cyclase
MTVMFSDVRGFTSVSELYRDDPQGLTALMNRFLTPLTNAILHRQGTIDKYMGDNIMAFWNAPLFVADHELQACEAALDMLDALAKLNADREAEAAAEGLPFIPLRIGIGLNAGPCVVGNMGSDLHFNYSVLGDTVNLASRLEGQSKRYGVPILVGPRIAEAVGERLALLELDRVRVVGKTEPELVFTVLGRGDVARDPAFRSLKEAHDAMLAAYRARDWAGALAAILQCRDRGRLYGIEALYETYVERVRTWMDTPPPADWDGVYVADSK